MKYLVYALSILFCFSSCNKNEQEKLVIATTNKSTHQEPDHNPNSSNDLLQKSEEIFSRKNQQAC